MRIFVRQLLTHTAGLNYGFLEKIAKGESIKTRFGGEIKMTKLFDNLKIGSLELKNRIIMSPMTRSRADDAGVQTKIVAEYYRQRASAGLIITEATNVSAMAKGYVRTPGIYTDEQIESWRKVTGAVHARGGKIFLLARRFF